MLPRPETQAPSWGEPWWTWWKGDVFFFLLGLPREFLFLGATTVLFWFVLSGFVWIWSVHLQMCWHLCVNCHLHFRWHAWRWIWFDFWSNPVGIVGQKSLNWELVNGGTEDAWEEPFDLCCSCSDRRARELIVKRISMYMYIMHVSVAFNCFGDVSRPQSLAFRAQSSSQT